MGIKKSLKDISWNVSEDEYRADPALSYSTIAKYEREGFNNLSKLFDRIDTPSLTFGSAVDSLITGGKKEFDERFFVADFPKVSDSLALITKALFTRYGDEYRNIHDIPDTIIAEVGKEHNFYAGDKYKDHRVKLIKECNNLYQLMYIAGDRSVLNTKEYEEIIATVNCLKNSSSTNFYFAEDNPFDLELERLYQLKFKGSFDGVNYRNMADLIVVNHKEKWILPIDLKTSSKPEWDFYKSFIEWRYDIQARLYWAIIRQNLDKDDYFKDFKLLDYRFIVVNKHTLTPLVWECPFTQSAGNLTFGKNNQIVLRSPFEIGRELNYYLVNKSSVPKGINVSTVNNLEDWLKEL